MKIKYRDSISWQNIGGVVFVFNEINGEMYCFNDVASDIWIQIGKSKCGEDVFENLKKIYGDVSELKDDLEEFLELLDKQNLIMKVV